MELTITGEVLSKLAGKSIDELQAILQTEEGELKEDAAEIFLRTTLDKFKGISKDQYLRGKREKGEQAESAIKPLFEKFSITEFETFEEGISQLSEKIKEAPPKGDTSKLDKDKMRKLPQFQELLNEALEAKNSEIADWKGKYEQYTSQVESEKFQNTVVQHFLEVLESEGVNARFTGESQKDKLSDVMFHLKAMGLSIFGTDSDGKPIPVDSDGNPLRDDASNPIPFDKFVKTNWKLGFDTVEPGRKFPSFNKGDKGGGSSIKITSEEDFERQMDAAGPDHKKRSEIRQAWAEHLKSQEE